MKQNKEIKKQKNKNKNMQKRKKRKQFLFKRLKNNWNRKD